MLKLSIRDVHIIKIKGMPTLAGDIYNSGKFVGTIIGNSVTIPDDLYSKIKEYTQDSNNTVEQILTKLLIDTDINNRYREICQTKTMFTIEDAQGRPQTYSNNLPYSEHSIKIIKERYGDRILEIINERFDKLQT